MWPRSHGRCEMCEECFFKQSQRRQVVTGNGCSDLRSRDIIDVIAERDEEIEKELRAAVVHFQLHCTAPLEGAPAADDEGEIVSPQLRVGVGSVGVGVSGRSQDGAALDS